MKVVLLGASGIGSALMLAGARRLLGDHEYSVLDRNRPATVYLRSGGPVPASSIRVLGRFHRLLHLPTAFAGADRVVHCGGPVVFPGVHRAPWQWPVWEEALGRSGRPVVLNLSGGSCFPWEARRAVGGADEAALRIMFSRSDLFTASDSESERVAASLGFAARLFPSLTMHAGGGESADGETSTLIINAARGSESWLEAMDEVVSRRSRTDRVLFLCHSASELDLANSRWPEHQAVLPRSVEEYFDVARRGRVALVNNASAAVALAGLGIPALCVGSDTRLLAVQETGQEIMFVGDATPFGLLGTLDMLDAEFESRRKALLALEERAFTDHREAVQRW